MRNIDMVVYVGTVMFGFVIGEYFFGLGVYTAIGCTIGCTIGTFLFRVR